MSDPAPPLPAPRHSIILRISGMGISISLLVLAAFYAYFVLFSTFMPYDDEGYMMIIEKHVLGGAKLYDEVPTLYGPLYFGITRVLHGMCGVPLSNNSARWITMAYWLATSGVAALVAWRLTRRATLGVISYAATFLYLVAIAAEPAHPQGMVVLLLATAAAIATWADPERPERIAAALGAVAAGLIMIKINVGIFASVSLLSAIMLSVQGRVARLASAAMVVAAIVLPFALLRQFLTVTWGLSFALVVASTFASSALVASVVPRPFPARPIRILGAFALAAIVAATLLVLSVLARGTTLHGLINVLLILPGRLSNVYVFPARFSKSAAVWAAGSAILAMAYWRVSRHSYKYPLLDFAVVAGKAALAAVLLTNVLRRSPLDMGNQYPLDLAKYVTPFLWLILVSPSSGGAAGVFPRLVVVLIAALQVLQGYPCAGGQLTMGTFLYIPIQVVCLGDTLDWAERHLATRAAAIRVLNSGVLVVALLIVALIGRRGYKLDRHYEDLVPLVGPEVRGADGIRTNEKAAATYQWLIANLIRHADTFESTISMNSLFFWTASAPPSKMAIGSTLDFYNDEQQQVIIEGLMRSPRTCVLYHPRLFDELLLPGGPPGPLLRTVREKFQSCGSVDQFDFCVRKGRDIPTLVDCVRLESPGDGPKVGPVSTKVTGALSLTAVPGRAASRLTIYDLDRKIILADTQPEGKTPALEIEASGTPVRIGSSDSRRLDLSAPPPLTLSFTLSDPFASEHFLVVRLIDQDGRIIKSIPFLKTDGPHKFFSG